MDPIAFKPSVTTRFVIKNNSKLNRAIKIFNTQIGPGNSLDLMRVPGITEEDIRSEVLKGSLRALLSGGSLNVTSSTVNFTTDDPNEITFLTSIGLSANLPTQVLTQTTWFVDPQNITGLADDRNTGIDATHPVMTWNGGVITKYGTFAPLIKQSVTITFLSSHTDNSDPVVFEPIMGGTAINIIMQGIIGASQTVATVTLSGVVAKNRSTNQLLNANLGAAATSSRLLQNTTHASWALTYKNVSGNVYSISQPFDVNSISSVDTWANGDTVVIYNPVSVNLVSINPRFTSADVNTFENGIHLQYLTVFSPEGSGNDPVSIGPFVYATNCIFQRYPSFSSVASGDSVNYYNCGFDGSIIGGPSLHTLASFLNLIYGYIRCSNYGQIWGENCVLDGDIIIESTGQRTVHMTSISLGFVYLDGGVFSANIKVAIYSTAVFWGTGKLDVQIGSTLIYTSPSTAVATFLNSGGLTINGGTTAYAQSVSGGTLSWLGPRTINPTNLDAAVTSGGFGGLAVVPGVGTIMVGSQNEQ